MARLADPLLREKLLNAARAVFAEKGFAKATMSEIAKQAGVAHGTTYLYFNSKDALAAALNAELNEKFLQVALPALMNPDLREGIRICVSEFFALCHAEQKTLHILYVTLGIAQTQQLQVTNQEHGKHSDELVRQYVDLLIQRMEKGEIHHYDDVQSLFTLLTGLFNWVALQAFASTQLSPEMLKSLEATFVHLLERALLP